METITGRERIRACMKRTYADRVPVGLILGPFRAKILGCPLKEYWLSGKKLAEGTLAGYHLFCYDSVEVSWDIVMEAETIGAELEFPTEGIPQVKKYVLAQKSALDSLSLSSPAENGRFPLYIEACRILARELKDVSLSGTVSGPWTIAAGLRGAQQLIFDTMDDPQFVHELLSLTTQVVKTLGTQILQTGLSLTMGEAACSCSLISPHIYRHFIKPRHQEIAAYFREKKFGLSLHICGFIDPIMADILDLGIVALSMDSPSSLAKMVNLSQKQIVLVGNIATSLFVQGSKEEMEAAVKNCLQVAARGGAYIISSGCELPYNSVIEKVQFFVEAAHRYGTTELIGKTSS